jgi:hypothetical protein
MQREYTRKDPSVQGFSAPLPGAVNYEQGKQGKRGIALTRDVVFQAAPLAGPYLHTVIYTVISYVFTHVYVPSHSSRHAQRGEVVEHPGRDWL